MAANSPAAILAMNGHDPSRARSEAARRRAEADLQRVQNAVAQIKYMTRLYRERLEGANGS